jgi:hypothetical protein
MVMPPVITAAVYMTTMQIYNFSMTNFHDFYYGMEPAEREKYAARVGTTVGYLERVAGGFALPSLPMALRLVRRSKGGTSVDAIVRCYEAKSGAIT